MRICQKTLIKGLSSKPLQIKPVRKSNPVKTVNWSAMLLVALGYACFVTNVSAQSSAPVETELQSVPIAPAKATQEPVYRVAKVKPAENVGTAAIKPAVIKVAAADNQNSPTVKTESPVEPAALRTASSANNSNNASLKNNVVPQVVPAKLASSSSIVDSRPQPVANAPHPLDRAINMASGALAQMRANVRDYSAILVKRERINGVVGSQNVMKVKIRCPRTVSQQQVPFSVYLKTLKPRKEAGREVIWVDGQNEGKLCAHETGILGMKRFYLDPTGWVAMQNNRYCIKDAGLENLMVKLVEKAEAAKASGHCLVTYRDNAEIMKRSCTVIELVNQKRLASDDFHTAQVFIDDELNMPVRYAAFDWPASPGREAEVIEEYTYVKVNINQGFSDIDFSADNPAYKFPRR